MNSELQSVIQDYSDQHGGVGLQATIVFQDGIVWNGEAGYADISKQCLITNNHHLYIGSMTKLFTAAMVMLQVEKGSLFLDSPISNWVSLQNANGITVRNLLNHASGLPDYARDTWFQLRWFGMPHKRWNPDELVRVIQSVPTHFNPGDQHEYSNSNYLIIGMIMEKITGTSYSSLLDEIIVKKLGLEDTFFMNYPTNLLIANGYDESLLHLGRRNLTAFRSSLESGAYSAGGILSTSNDVARFVHSLFTGHLVSAESLAEMESFGKWLDEDVPEQTGYGLGIRQMLIGNELLVGHTGSIPGYSGIVMHNEQKGYTIAILSNLSTIEQTSLLARIQGVILQ